MIPKLGAEESLHFVSLFRSLMKKNSCAAFLHFTRYTEPCELLLRKSGGSSPEVFTKTKTTLRVVLVLVGAEGLEPPTPSV